MATFSVSFLGCKVSFADAQATRERLVRDGHTELNEDADVVVVNTCCVTHEAVSKSRQALARAARRHRRVYATGCAARLEGAFDGLPENVRVISRTGDDAAVAVATDVGPLGCTQSEARLERTRAFVKIQDGCSFSCAFCVIPIVRGATRSRSADHVLTEIRRRVSQGHREIVLTGVNLGCFRDREAGYTLARLVREAGTLPGVERLRLSSIEVNHLSAELVEALVETDRASAHLRVPLQSGDDEVLRAMGRRYSTAQYLAKVESLSRFNLTTDVIVGFTRRERRRVRAHARRRPGRRDHEGARLPVLTAAWNGHSGSGHGPACGEEGTQREVARSLGGSLPSPLGVEDRDHRPCARRSPGARIR